MIKKWKALKSSTQTYLLALFSAFLGYFTIQSIPFDYWPRFFVLVLNVIFSIFGFFSIVLFGRGVYMSFKEGSFLGGVSQHKAIKVFGYILYFLGIYFVIWFSPENILMVVFLVLYILFARVIKKIFFSVFIKKQQKI